MKFVNFLLSVSLFELGSAGTPAEWGQGVRQFNILYDARMKVVDGALGDDGERDMCPRYEWKFWLTGYEPKREFTLNPHSSQATGFAADIYRIDDVIFKYHTSPYRDLIESLATEYAGLKLMENTRGIPRVYDIQKSNLGRGPCFARILVTSSGGDTELRYFKRSVHERADYHLLMIAARATEILKEVHKRGIIHGDIHWRNFMFTPSAADLAGSLNLIDFGRAQPFVDSSGEPLTRKNEQSTSIILSSMLLSPWEIEGSILARRDDFFRLAETLLRAGGYVAYPSAEEGKVLGECKDPADPKSTDESCAGPRLAELKRNREFGQTTPPVLVEFYQATLALDLMDAIDYDYWAERFRSEADLYGASQRLAGTRPIPVPSLIDHTALIGQRSPQDQGSVKTGSLGSSTRRIEVVDHTARINEPESLDLGSQTTGHISARKVADVTGSIPALEVVDHTAQLHVPAYLDQRSVKTGSLPSSSRPIELVDHTARITEPASLELRNMETGYIPAQKMGDYIESIYVPKFVDHTALIGQPPPPNLGSMTTGSLVSSSRPIEVVDHTARINEPVFPDLGSQKTGHISTRKVVDVTGSIPALKFVDHTALVDQMASQDQGSMKTGSVLSPSRPIKVVDDTARINVPSYPDVESANTASLPVRVWPKGEIDHTARFNAPSTKITSQLRGTRSGAELLEIPVSGNGIIPVSA